MAAAPPGEAGLHALAALETALTVLGPLRGKFKDKLARVASYARTIDEFLSTASVPDLKRYLPVLHSAGLTWCRPIRAQLPDWSNRQRDMQIIVGSCPPPMVYSPGQQHGKKRQRDYVPLVRLLRLDFHLMPCMQYFSSLPPHERLLDGLVDKPLLSGPLALALLREPICDVELYVPIYTYITEMLTARRPLNDTLHKFLENNKPAAYRKGHLRTDETATRVEILNANVPSLMKSALQCAHYLCDQNSTCPDFLKKTGDGHIFLRRGKLADCFFCHTSTASCICLMAKEEFELMQDAVRDEHVRERRHQQPPLDTCASARVWQSPAQPCTHARRRFAT